MKSIIPASPTPERDEFLALFEGGVRYGALLRDGTEFMSLAVAGHKYEPRDDCEIIDYDRAVATSRPRTAISARRQSRSRRRRGDG